MKRGGSLLIYKKYWMRVKELIDEFRHSLAKVESEMQEEIENSNIEFLFKDGKCTGIKDNEKIIQKDELEKD